MLAPWSVRLAVTFSSWDRSYARSFAYRSLGLASLVRRRSRTLVWEPPLAWFDPYAFVGEVPTVSYDMYRDVDWLRPADPPILSAIAALDGRWIKPASLSLNITYSRYTVAGRCRTLGAKGLLDTHDDVAAYRINDRGLAFLAGDLPTHEIE